MLILNLNKIKINNKTHNLGKWELYFTKKKIYINDDGIKQQCLAITDFDNETIKVYSRQSIQELKNSLRHEFFHIIEDYRKCKKISDEDIVCLQERLVNIADDLIDKRFAEEI